MAEEPAPRFGPQQEDTILLPLTLAENIAEGIVVIDRRSRIRYVNQSLTRIFGYSREELRGSSLTRLMPEEFRDRHRHSFYEYLVTGERHLDWGEVELPGLHRDGSELSLRISFTEFSRRGTRFFCGAIRDVTGAGEPDADGRTAARRYRVLFEENVAAVFRVARDGRVLDVNPSFAEMSGHDSPGELEGREVQSLFADGGERTRFLRDLREHRDVRNRELELRRRTGGSVWSLVNAVWVEAADAPDAEVLVGTATDISDRKRVERELQLSENRYRRLFEQSLVGVYRSEPEPGGEILACNQVIADMFGYDSPEQLVGLPADRFYGGGKRQRGEVLDRLREEGILLEYGLELERRDGTPLRVLSHAQLIQGPDGERLVEGLFLDVTDRVRAEEERKERERRFRQVAEHIDEVFWLRTPDRDEVLYVNPAFEKVTGVPRERVYEDPSSWLDLVHPDDRADVKEAYLDDEEGGYEQEYRVVRPDGDVRWVRDRAFPVEDDDGEVYRIVGIAQDVTEERKAREALRRAKEKFRGVFDISPVALIVADPGSGRRVEVNRAFTEVFGWERDDLIADGVDASDLWEDRERRRKVAARLRSGETVRNVEAPFRRRDGSCFDGLVSASVLDFGGETYWITAVQDISPMKEVERELEYQALHDQLTGLPNRTLFWDRVEHAMARAQRAGDLIAVLFLDLDGFKRVNDDYGHGGGDDLLRQLAERLAAVVREQDTVARVGGDEYAVLVEDLESEERARDVAERLLDQFRRPFRVGGDEVPLEASCGIAFWRGGDRDPEAETPEPGQLVREADLAMYAAKEEPGSRYRTYAPGVRADEPRKLRDEMRLRRALEDRELEPYYQPIVSLEDGRLVGCEVLARWRDPERGLVSPAHFIPLAEETGLIVELGHQISRRAWADLLRWKSGGLLPPDFRLHLNFSARQLQDPSLLESLKALLEDGEVDPGLLAFEITESAAMGRRHVTARLQDLGVGVSIDDFGTEYATLERLVTLDVDSLKVDRSFVSDMVESERHAAVVQATLSVADALGIPAVAEGVETEDQRSRLRELGCRYGQGFLFARPMPGEEFGERLENR